MNSARCSLLACLVCLSNLSARADDPQTAFSTDQIEFFEKKIRPIFVEHCHECHAGDEPEAGLRLTSREATLRGGDSGPAIVPGLLDEGELLLAVSYDADGYQMPPESKLPDEEINLLREWVAMGAPWPDEEDVAGATEGFDLAARAERFSFQPLQQVQPPDVQHAAWPRMPIDRFLLAKLEAAGLTPAAATDRRTWIRRAYFDTIGLPPTPEQVQLFLDDDSPEAFERVVDGLLASPHFGERWGRHWLDLVRYAESRGHEFDYDVPNSWHYRDYVVRALNDDVPYDQLVVEHVAGDLLQASGGRQPTDSSTSGLTPAARHALRLHPDTGANESILGTGFWFLGEWVHSPVDIRQEEADRFDNMIDVYSKTFLGLTVACARCHDHKFDPITQADFYALQGYLQSSSYRQARFETMEHNRRGAEQLQDLRAEAARVILRTVAEIAQPTIDKLDRYLIAAHDAIQIGPEFTSDDAEISYEDFEDGTYGSWEVTGDAFGAGPQTQETIAPYQGDVKAAGTFFVNSHQKRDGGRGDQHIGTLTSDEFTIERNYIRFLIGGGAHEGKTCVNLLVDGQSVLSTTGRNSNEMFAVTWDVTDHTGKTARIQVVDSERGGWGNVGVDEFVFSNAATSALRAVRVEAFDEAYREKVRTIAAERQLNSELLLNWIGHLIKVAHDEQDPFHYAGQFMTGRFSDPIDPGTDEDANVEPGAAEFFTGYAFSMGTDREVSFQPFVEGNHLFRSGLGNNRTASALTFDLSDDPGAPIARLEDDDHVELDSIFRGVSIADGTSHDPGRIEPFHVAGRALRTQSFDITENKLFCLIRGGVNTYIAVDSHILINGPLHGSLIKEHPAPESGSDTWRWIEHDVSRYTGHRAHVELVPRDGESFAIRAAFLGDGKAPPPFDDSYGRGPLSVRLLSLSRLHSAADLAGTYQRWLQTFDSTIESFFTIVAHTGPMPRHVQWVLAHPHLLGLNSETAKARFTEVSTPFIERRRELIAQIRPVSATAPCMLDGSGEDEYVFIRGAWRKPGETVPRRFLEVFDGHGPADTETQASAEQGSGRLDLALQMIDSAQTPILPRVVVNRIWQHYFGRGIVPTPDDFGHMGQEPSHPELLDWLANDLVEHDWSLKHVHRQILLSAAYRMKSSVWEQGESNQPADDGRSPGEVDPQNVLLHRMNVKRLEGEIIRDAVLAVSGRLDENLYGRSVPVHLTPFMEGRGRPGQSGPVDGHGRRSIYIAVRRNFAEPFFQAFDFPNPHTTTGRRSISNVPAQALALMNNPLIVQQSRVCAERLLTATPGAAAADRVTRLYETAFSRPPTDDELAAGTIFVEAQAAEYNINVDHVRVWTDYCHVLVNVKEFVFVQ